MRCMAAKCDNEANAFLLTQGQYSPVNGGTPEVRDTLCYTHYVEERRADGHIVACRARHSDVTLRDVSGKDVENRGDTVEFDDEETDVDLLVRCGFVDRLDGPSLAESLAAEEEAIAARLAVIQARRKDADKQARAETAKAKREAAKADAADTDNGED